MPSVPGRVHCRGRDKEPSSTGHDDRRQWVCVDANRSTGVGVDLRRLRSARPHRPCLSTACGWRLAARRARLWPGAGDRSCARHAPTCGRGHPHRDGAGVLAAHARVRVGHGGGGDLHGWPPGLASRRVVVGGPPGCRWRPPGRHCPHRLRAGAPKADLRGPRRGHPRRRRDDCHQPRRTSSSRCPRLPAR